MTRPAQDRRWSVAMTWSHLAFLHWPIEPAQLHPLIPPGLELELYDAKAWIGVVPFLMSGVRHRVLPPIYGTSRFPELNVRTYVRCGGYAGVWFFSLDAMSRLAVWGARRWFHLPYYYAQMQCQYDGEQVGYTSRRKSRGRRSDGEDRLKSRVDARWWVRPQGSARFAATYGPTGAPFEARAGSLEHFLTARYCLFACNQRGEILRGDIDHVPWPLQPAQVDIHENTMLDVLGLSIPLQPPHSLYVQNIRTVAWSERTAFAEEQAALVVEPGAYLSSASR